MGIRMSLLASIRRRLTAPVTPEQATRVRLHLALIPVYVWLFFAWGAFIHDFAVPGRFDRAGHIKGHDFVHFYMLGGIAIDRATPDLYDFDAQSKRLDRLVPEYETRFLPVHTPQVALFFAPIAALPYVAAIWTWLLISACLYAASCWALWRALPALHDYTGIAVLLAAGFPAAQAMAATGQTSAFALAWLVLAYLALRRRHDVLAGMALGMLAYKPTFGLLVPFALLSTRQFRATAAAAGTALLQFVIAWAYFGREAIIDYVRNFETISSQRSLLEAQPYAMHSLLAFFSMLMPSDHVAKVAYLVTSGIVAAMAIRVWRSRSALEVRYGTLIIASVLVSPHFYVYDLVILAAAFFLLASWAVQSTRRRVLFWTLGYAAFYLPALEGLVQRTHVQWTVPVSFGLVIYLICSTSRSDLLVETKLS